MFIAYKEDGKEQYVSQSELNPKNLPALKIKTAEGDKFAFLKTSGNNLSKIKMNISDKSWYLQKINPVCIAISTSSTYKLFTFLDNKLQEVNYSVEGSPEKYRQLKFLKFIPEYGVYIAFLYTQGDASSGGWKWFFQSAIYSQENANFIGVSFDGVNFTFYPAPLSEKEKPLYIFYNTEAKIIDLWCYYISGGRPAVNTDPPQILEFDIKEILLTKTNCYMFGMNEDCFTVVKTKKGNIFYVCNNNSTEFGCLKNRNILFFRYTKDKKFEIFYNQTLEMIYVKASGSGMSDILYRIADSDSPIEDDVEDCPEDEFYVSYGNINGYEVFNETQIYKDFNNKIDLGKSLYSLNPPSISYDFYSKNYIAVSKDASSVYIIKYSSDFSSNEILYTTSLSDITFCTTASLLTSDRINFKKQ